VNLSDLINDVSAALGFEDAQPLTQDGQKLVLKGTLSGAPAVAKVVLLSPDPNGDITLQRAHREVELLSAVDSHRVVRVLTDAVEIGDPPAAVCWAEEYLEGADLSASLDHAWDELEVLPPPCLPCTSASRGRRRRRSRCAGGRRPVETAVPSCVRPGPDVGGLEDRLSPVDVYRFTTADAR
jgi:hypothetical protein